MIAQRCSYSRFKNSAQSAEDPEKRSSDVKDNPDSPKAPQRPESRPKNTALSRSHDAEPMIIRQMEETAHAPEESSHHIMDPQTLADPPFLERAKNFNALTVSYNNAICKSNHRVPRIPLQQNKGCYNLAQNPWQVTPLLIVAGGPYEAKWIHHKYMYHNTRPW